MRGDKKMPTELRLLRLTGKKAEKLAKKVIPTPGPLVEPPDWLSAEQKKEWNYVIENAPRNVLKKIDKSVVAAFIVAQDTHRRAVESMHATQLLIKSPKQELPMQNPYLPIVNRQAVLLARIATELGFTPCARARIESGKPQSPEVSDWSEIATG